MTADEREMAGLQRAYRGLVGGVALMPDGCESARALAPLIRELEASLIQYASEETR